MIVRFGILRGPETGSGDGGSVDAAELNSGADQADLETSIDADLNEIWSRNRGEGAAAADDSAAAAGHGDGRARDEQGRFAPKQTDQQPGSAKDATQGDAQVDTKTQQQQDQQQADTSALKAPDDWDATLKTTFERLPGEARQDMLNVYKSIQRGFGQKFEALADERKYFEAVRPALAPIEEEAKRYGVTTDAAIRGLWAAHNGLLNDATRIQAIKNIAKDYDIDLAAAAAAPDVPIIDPHVLTPLNERLTRLETSHTEERQRIQADAEERAISNDASVIDRWAKEAGADGKTLLRPHFEKVADRMATLLTAFNNAGDKRALLDRVNEAYETACAADPVIRQRMIDDRVAEQTRTATARTRGTRAEGASSTAITRAGASKAAKDVPSVDGKLEEVWSKHAGSA
jgi:hypothetical protein